MEAKLAVSKHFSMDMDMDMDMVIGMDESCKYVDNNDDCQYNNSNNNNSISEQNFTTHDAQIDDGSINATTSLLRNIISKNLLPNNSLLPTILEPTTPTPYATTTILTNYFLNETSTQVTLANIDGGIPLVPSYIRHTAMFLCVSIMVLGIIGNVMVPIVIIKTKDMRNSTNIFLTNLSIADLLVLLVCTPTVLVEVNTRPETWILGHEMCKAVPFVELTVAHASVLTILAISFERYYAICEPLKAGYVCTKTRAILICILAWGIAALFTSPIIFIATYRHERYYDGTEVAVCFTSADTFWSSFYFIASITVFFALPFFILVLLYAAIAYKLLHRNSAFRRPVSPVSTLQQQQQLKQSNTQSESTESFIAGNTIVVVEQQRRRRQQRVRQQQQQQQQHQQSNNMRKNRKQVIFMLVTVVASFFICLLPFRAFTLWVISSAPSDMVSLGVEGYYNLLYFCRFMLYLNSALNPILYNIMSSKFRNGFWRLIVTCWGGKQKRRLLLRGHKTMRHRRQGLNQTSGTVMPDAARNLKRHSTFINSTTSTTSSTTGNEQTSCRSNSTSTTGNSINSITTPQQNRQTTKMHPHLVAIVDSINEA